MARGFVILLITLLVGGAVAEEEVSCLASELNVPTYSQALGPLDCSICIISDSEALMYCTPWVDEQPEAEEKEEKEDNEENTPTIYRTSH